MENIIINVYSSVREAEGEEKNTFYQNKRSRSLCEKDHKLAALVIVGGVNGKIVEKEYLRNETG